MTEERPDASLLIGLHKLAEQNGDGFVPELYALLAAQPQADRVNVVPFPAERRVASSHYTRDGPGEVVAFRR
ncbi:hypothetical protein [Pseudorhizobium marinum]|uniref:hypothetical protein n=1 Tax=Pseudorhizobium marinum TaxID=1496690 RepID=UPI0005632116|nr:hypothetical protein [Pseudorhizobium marinum]